MSLRLRVHTVKAVFRDLRTYKTVSMNNEPSVLMLNRQLMLPQRKCSFLKRPIFCYSKSWFASSLSQFHGEWMLSNKIASMSWTINGYRNPLIRKRSSLTLEMTNVPSKILIWRWIIITWLISITQGFWAEYKTSFSACSIWQLCAASNTFAWNHFYKRVCTQRHDSESKTVSCFAFPSFLLKSLLFPASFMSI